MSAQKPLVVRSDGYVTDLKLGVTLQVNAARTDSASINAPHGVAPAAPVDGDFWSTSSGFYGRVSGVTVPFGGGTVTSVGVVSSTLSVSGSPVSGSGDITVDLPATGVTAGSYINANVTVDAEGRVTAISSGNATITATAASPPASVCFMIDVSNDYFGNPTMAAAVFADTISGIRDVLATLLTTFAAGLDVCVVACGDSGTATSITKRSASSGDITSVDSFVAALTQSAAYGFDAPTAMTTAKTFFDATSSAITYRRLIWVWQGASDTGGTPTTSVWLAGANTAAATMATIYPPVLCNVINQEQSNTTYAAPIDNTPDDGIPLITTRAALASAIEAILQAVGAGPGYLSHAGGGARVVAADALISDPTSAGYRPCNCWIGAASTVGASTVVDMPGQFVGQTGLNAGATYWLAPGGGLTATAPSTSGNLDQVAGFADQTGTKLFFAPQRGLGV